MRKYLHVVGITCSTYMALHNYILGNLEVCFPWMICAILSFGRLCDEVFEWEK